MSKAGGDARAKALAPDRRSEIAADAARARWSKSKGVDLETTLLQALEEKVRAMFTFTGWADDVDKDAAQSVINVEAVLKDLAAWRLLQQRYLSDSASTDEQR